MARCYPDPDTWDDLRVDLTSGERRLAESLIRALGDEWRLYLQPHVGGTRPDAVLVHPRAGVQIIEVKDYDLGAYDLSGQTWEVRTGDGDLHATRDPFTQADAAREALFQILLPVAGEARAETPSRYGFARASVFLSEAGPRQIEEAEAYLKRTRKGSARHYGLAGRDAPAEGLEDLVGILGYEDGGSPHVEAIEERAADIGLGREWHEVLHGWLQPTPDEAAQNEPLALTPEQKTAASSQAGRLLITGPAGSGKTLALARRAARALVKGKDVLLLGYNITLWHYVRDLVARGVRAALLQGLQHTREERRRMGEAEVRRRARQNLAPRYRKAMRGLQITHYHRLAYMLLDSVGVDAEDVHPDEVARILCGHAGRLRRLAGDRNTSVPQVDTLLVDEGQDWGPRWLESLRPLLREQARAAVAADFNQRLYGHAAQNGRELFGQEPSRARLSGTARVPKPLLPAVNAVTSAWPPPGGDGAEAPADLQAAEQLQLDFDGRPEPEAVWTAAPGGAGALLEAVAGAAREHVLDGVNPSQIAVLVPTHAAGRALEARLEADGPAVCSVCVDDPDGDRSRKHAFWRLDPRLKVCTVHSFKGWEADVVVVLLPQVPPRPGDRSALHVALTRTRAVLEVVAPSEGPDLPGWSRRRGEDRGRRAGPGAPLPF